MKRTLLTFLMPLFYFPPIIILTREFGKSGELEVSERLQILGLLIAFSGLSLWALGFLGLGKKGFAVLPKAKALQTTGIYRYFRHPIYMGISLTYLGLSFSVGSLLSFLYTLVVLIPLFIFRAKKEEEVLKEKFGKRYSEYERKTFF